MSGTIEFIDELPSGERGRRRQYEYLIPVLKEHKGKWAKYASTDAAKPRRLAAPKYLRDAGIECASRSVGEAVNYYARFVG